MNRYYERTVKLPKGWHRMDMGSFTAIEKETGRKCRMKRGLLGYCSSKRTETFEDYGYFRIPVICEEGMKGSRLILNALTAIRGEAVPCLILSVFAAMLGMIVPFVTNIMISHLLVYQNVLNYQIINISVFMAVTASIMINVMVGRMRARVQSQVAFTVFVNMIRRIMGMNSGDEKEISGRLIGRFLPFIGAVEEVTGSLFSGFVYLMQCVMLIVLIVCMNFRNTFLKYVLILILINMICSVLMIKKADRYRHEEADKRADYTGRGREMIDGMEAVKVSQAEDRILERVLDSYNGYFSLRIKLEKNNLCMNVLAAFFNGAGIMLIFLAAEMNGNSTYGNVSVMVSMYSLLMGYITPLISSVTKLLIAMPRLDFAEMVMSRRNEISFLENHEQEEELRLSGNIELSHVVFSYDSDREPVIKDISLSVSPGEYVGIAGASGSGKSTLMRLLLGFEVPDSGHIFYDGSDLTERDPRTVRSRFGTVLQNDSLISGSIAMNIGLSEHPDMEKVAKAAATVAIADEVEKMPMGYHTIVSSESELLSGGEKQRVMLARALYDSPVILFLDEATSAMDNSTQKVVNDNLEKMNITRIVVAHRLSTVKDCDRIIVLEDGKIVEEGSFEELIEKGGTFAAMTDLKKDRQSDWMSENII